MRKLAPARVSHWDHFLISYRVYMMTGSFLILLFNGTFHVDKIRVCFKIANITHALTVPVYRQTDFTPKWVVVSCLHDAIARFRTGVKFSPPCENRGDSRRHNILWWCQVNKSRAMRGNRRELAPGRKSLMYWAQVLMYCCTEFINFYKRIDSTYHTPCPELLEVQTLSIQDEQKLERFSS